MKTPLFLLFFSLLAVTASASVIEVQSVYNLTVASWYPNIYEGQRYGYSYNYSTDKGYFCAYDSLWVHTSCVKLAATNAADSYFSYGFDISNGTVYYQQFRNFPNRMTLSVYSLSGVEQQDIDNAYHNGSSLGFGVYNETGFMYEFPSQTEVRRVNLTTFQLIDSDTPPFQLVGGGVACVSNTDFIYCPSANVIRRWQYGSDSYDTYELTGLTGSIQTLSVDENVLLVTTDFLSGQVIYEYNLSNEFFTAGGSTSETLPQSSAGSSTFAKQLQAWNPDTYSKLQNCLQRLNDPTQLQSFPNAFIECTILFFKYLARQPASLVPQGGLS